MWGRTAVVHVAGHRGFPVLFWQNWAEISVSGFGIILRDEAVGKYGLKEIKTNKSCEPKPVEVDFDSQDDANQNNCASDAAK